MNEEEKKQKARENARRYYEKNKEKVLAKQKEYVKNKYANDEEFRKKAIQRNRKYALKNKEKVRELKRKWANKHYQELREKGLLKPTKNEIINILQSKIDKINEYVNKIYDVMDYKDYPPYLDEIYYTLHPELKENNNV